MWYVITIPFRNRDKLISEAIERGIIATGISNSEIDIYIPTVENDLFFENYGFLYLPKCNDFQFFKHFDDSLHSLFVLRCTNKYSVFVPSSIEESCIQQIQTAVYNFIHKEEKIEYSFFANDRVVIIKGAFLGFYGTVVSYCQIERRVYVRIFFFGQDMTIVVTDTDLEKVGGTNAL